MPKSPKKVVKTTLSAPDASAPRPAPAPKPAPASRPAPTQPRTVPPAPAVESRRPMRESARRAMETIRIANQKAESETDDDDSVWSVTEEGVDDEVCEKLYTFFKQQKKADKVNASVYSYLIKVMDDKEEFDEDHPYIKRLETLLPDLNSKFRVFNREEYEDGNDTVFNMKELLKYIEAGMDDDYEDDGWLVNDL